MGRFICPVKLRRALSDVHETPTAIGVLLLLGYGFGILCRLNCNNETLLNNQMAFKHSFFGYVTTELCDFC